MSLGNVDLIKNLVNTTAFANAEGNSVHGEGETIEFLSFDTNGNNIQVTDSDNETFNLSLNDVAKELGMTAEDLKAQLGKTDAAKETEETEATKETGAATEAGKAEAADKSSDAIQKEIDALNEDRAASMGELKALETDIKELTDTIQSKLEEAAKKQEAKLEAHQEAVEKAIAAQVEEYKKAAQSDKPMSKDDLKSNINASIAKIDGIGAGTDVVSDLFMIAGELTTLDNKLGQVKNLTDHVAGIDSQLEVKGQELEAAKQAEAAAAAQQSSKSCDPIGFQMETAEGEAMQVDFFVDRDGDGTVTDASEFLGAVADAKGEDGWSEMAALNTDGNDTIDSEELKANEQLKVMVTIGDEQKAMSIAEFEETYGELEINANKDAETNTANGPKNFDAEGYDNERLGSFGLTVGGQALTTGYQTKDDMDYLNDNYDFSSGSAEGKDGNALQVAAGLEIDATDKVDEAGEAEAAEGTEDLQHYVDFFADYTEKAQELREQLENEWLRHGLNEEFITTINKSAAIIAEGKVADVETKDEADETGEAEEDEAIGTEAVGEANATENDEAEEAEENEEKEQEAA